ncbi:MAG: histidine phosphatase family protein [Comamonas sp.]
MDLILWRHAEAQEAAEDIEDEQRILTPRGEKQASRMAAWLDRQLPEGVRILCSPAVRTEQTAKALGRKFKRRAELLPDGQVQDLLDLAQWPASRAPVLVVGHQPMLGQAVARVMGWPVADCSIRKGAVWWLRHREREGHGQTVLLTVQSPDFL